MSVSKSKSRSRSPQPKARLSRSRSRSRSRSSSQPKLDCKCKIPEVEECGACGYNFCKTCRNQDDNIKFCFLCLREDKDNAQLLCSGCMGELKKCQTNLAHTNDRYICFVHRYVHRDSSGEMKVCCRTCSFKKDSDQHFKLFGGRFINKEEDRNKSPQILEQERAELNMEEDEEEDEEEESEVEVEEVEEAEEVEATEDETENVGNIRESSS